MQKIANDNNVNLRPHTKTHKSPDLARKQLRAGAVGVAVAKLGEAEVMAAHGFDDIQIANIIVGDIKIRRLLDLHRKVKRITCTVDSIVAAKAIAEAFKQNQRIMEVFIEINTGHNRSGLNELGKIKELAEFILNTDYLKFAGLFSHPGHAYNTNTIGQVKTIAKQEADQLFTIHDELGEESIVADEISVGSTPTARFSAKILGINEIRPGNYIFYDVIQVSLGSCTFDDCALNVLTTVISTPSQGIAIIDAGAKALSLDRVMDGHKESIRHGYIKEKSAQITRISEEHGIIEYKDESFQIGERIRIIPNHACVVMNLFDYAYIVDGDEVIEQIKIEGRGKSQ